MSVFDNETALPRTGGLNSHPLAEPRRLLRTRRPTRSLRQSAGELRTTVGAVTGATVMELSDVIIVLTAV
jgi:hypothetical protein